MLATVSLGPVGRRQIGHDGLTGAGKRGVHGELLGQFGLGQHHKLEVERNPQQQAAAEQREHAATGTVEGECCHHARDDREAANDAHHHAGDKHLDGEQENTGQKEDDDCGHADPAFSTVRPKSERPVTTMGVLAATVPRLTFAG